MSKDLILLVADKDMEKTLQELLSRPQSLGLREISWNLYVHPGHDPACRGTSHEFLRPFVRMYSHALVLFDRHGCGQEGLDRAALEQQVEARLFGAGWGERAAAVVIDPELEAWVWSDSPHVAMALGWKDREGSLKELLKEKGWLPEGRIKPTQPKEAVKEALRIARQPPSSAIYQQLAQRVSFDRCVDASFLKLRQVLSLWFARQS
jgi:hypothetical protein